jgi:hypothetical protein
MREQRVVDIHFAESKSYGSGYLLSDRLILTARHVAKPAATETVCIARRWKLVDCNLDAKVAWLSERHDVALISLDRPVVADLGEAPVFGRCPEQSGSELYDCFGIGFPRASKDDENRRIDKKVRGFAELSFRSDMFDVTPRGALPTVPLGWKGFSGAALFSRDLLFGVVSVVPEDWDGRAIYAVAIDRLLDEEGFREALAEGGLPDPTAAMMRDSRYYGRLSEEIAKYFFFLDRVPQEKEFHKSLKPSSGGSFVVAADSKDRPDMLMTRFANDDNLREILGDAVTDKTIELLLWPGFDIDSAEAQFQRLKEDCAKLLGLQPADAADPDSFSKALGHRRAAGVWWKINPQKMGPGHAELLQRWIDFCTKVEAGPSPFFWFCCWLTDETKSNLPSFFTPKPDPGVPPLMEKLIGENRVINLGLLEKVDAQTDLDPWIAQLAARARLDDDRRRDLEERLRPELGMAVLPLDEFTEKMKFILRGEDA